MVIFDHTRSQFISHSKFYIQKKTKKQSVKRGKGCFLSYKNKKKKRAMKYRP